MTHKGGSKSTVTKICRYNFVVQPSLRRIRDQRVRFMMAAGFDYFSHASTPESETFDMTSTMHSEESAVQSKSSRQRRYSPYPECRDSGGVADDISKIPSRSLMLSKDSSSGSMNRGGSIQTQHRPATNLSSYLRAPPAGFNPATQSDYVFSIVQTHSSLPRPEADHERSGTHHRSASLSGSCQDEPTLALPSALDQALPSRKSQNGGLGSVDRGRPNLQLPPLTFPSKQHAGRQTAKLSGTPPTHALANRNASGQDGLADFSSLNPHTCQRLPSVWITTAHPLQHAVTRHDSFPSGWPPRVDHPQRGSLPISALIDTPSATLDSLSCPTAPVSGSWRETAIAPVLASSSLRSLKRGKATQYEQTTEKPLLYPPPELHAERGDLFINRAADPKEVRVWIMDGAWRPVPRGHLSL
ncbi:hypothetical protein FA13DRAFT_1796943 [Coprinellus micaceus]|uniref:Uncharacterized protein n=1 Tax=Coprinellus micaceus TaxID=71717 RepID=A0A4Y7SS97_COPMI|nr:hypothetical protein FA13DRAFT_1796943 [Coprinellus micaceus]